MKTLKTVARAILYSGLPVPGFIKPLIRLMYRVGVVAVEGLAFVRKVFWVEPVLRSVCLEVGKGIRAERLPYMRGRGNIRLGSNVNLSGRSCFYFINGMPETPEISIGDNVFLGNGCTLSAAVKISIGSYSQISAGVRIHDNDGHPLNPQKRRENCPITPEDAAPVTIGENVWLGAEAVILKGVTIGRNSVVGTRSVVTSDVPENVVVAGNPARVVKQLEQ